MDIQVALGILRKLSDGVNPITGEVFPSGSPYQQPEIIRALFTTVDALEKIHVEKPNRENLPVNAGKPWTNEEDRILIERFDKGLPIDELSKEHCRTPGAITSRLVKLGRINLTDK